jgi:nitrate/TMAO reductase-like tetraheme cytochrome c subunit
MTHIATTSLRAGQVGLAGLIVLLFCLIGGIAHADVAELGKAEKDCLSCHDKEDVKKVLQNGEVLSMRISTKAYAESMHNETACEDCHSDLDAKTHGKVKSDIASKRDFTVAQGNACRDCH